MFLNTLESVTLAEIKRYKSGIGIGPTTVVMVSNPLLKRCTRCSNNDFLMSASMAMMGVILQDHEIPVTGDKLNWKKVNKKYSTVIRQKYVKTNKQYLCCTVIIRHQLLFLFC